VPTPPDKQNAEPDSAATEFARQAQEAPPSALAEIWSFLKQNKKWWVTPVVVILLLFGFLVIISGTSVAPFIYSLF
jgi:hypothetical protein